MAAGEFINDAAIAAGSYRKQGTRWLAAVGGVRPRRGRNLKGRCLTLARLNPVPPGIISGEGLEIGWRLARHAWGHGYATEAGRAAVDVARRIGAQSV